MADQAELKKLVKQLQGTSQESVRFFCCAYCKNIKRLTSVAFTHLIGDSQPVSYPQERFRRK